MATTKRVLKEACIYLLSSLAGGVLLLRRYWWAAAGAYQMRRIIKRGVGCSFEGPGVVYEPNDLVLGDHVAVGRNFFLRCAGGVRIGSYTHISRNVTIHTVNHNWKGESLPYDRVNVTKPVVIGRYVWVGMNVSILPGVTIGDGAVIGMGTVISRDVPKNAIVVGMGQRIVGYRDEQKTNDLVGSKSFLIG